MSDHILHIGRHKTGTSSLQSFLHDNRAALHEHGFLYPQAGASHIAHHHVARLFARQPHQRPDAAQAAQVREALARETEGAGGKAVLLSSEAFQNADPAAVAQVFAPGRTRIVAYIREQAGYVVSAYQQKVHATGYWRTLEESVRALTVDYDRFLGEWEQVFGSANVSVRIYEREALAGGDIVADFLQVLGLPREGAFALPQEDRNPSIGGALLEFKRLLNACHCHDLLQGRLYAALSRMALEEPAWRARPALAADTVQRVRESVAASNAAVARRHFGREQLFALPPQPAAAQPVLADEVDAILARLQALEPRVHQLVTERLALVLPAYDALRGLRENGPAPVLDEAAARLLRTLPRPRAAGRKDGRVVQ